MANTAVLIKPVSGSCNLRCKYCFYFDEMKNRTKSNYGSMDYTTLENIVKKTIEISNNEATFSFQGGEPTLRGIDFFEKLIELQIKYNTKKIKINNSLQTNGFNLSDEFIDFFYKNNFLIGISIDGTKHTNDAFRIDEKNNGTFDSIINTINKFNNKNIQYNVLTVVNSKTAKNITTIYNFYKKNKIKYMQFIPCIQPIDEQNKVYPFTLTTNDYTNFLIKLFDLWYDDIIKKNNVFIQQFVNYKLLLNATLPSDCGVSGICSLQTVIEANGDVFPCDFYVLDQYKIGNINIDSFKDFDVNRENIKFVENSIKLNDKCMKCKYLNLCRGGCKRYRDESKIHIYCKSYIKFFEYSLAKFNKL